MLNNENFISGRIVEIMHNYRINNAELSKKLGLTSYSTMSRIVSGKVNPSYEILCKILEAFPEVSGTWLITGRGKMLAGDVVKSEEKSTECKECAVKQSMIEEKQILIEEKERNIQNLERTIKILMK